MNPNSENDTSHLGDRVAKLETVIKEVSFPTSVYRVHALSLPSQLKNHPPRPRWIQDEHKTPPANSFDISPRLPLTKDMSPLTPHSTSASSPQPSSSSSSDVYIGVPSHTPHGPTEHDPSALFTPSLQQEPPKPDVLAQLTDRLASIKACEPDRLGHCGCANETSSYIVLLELSLRLRKASEVVGQHFKHFPGSTCSLNQKITEFDKFISYVEFTNHRSCFGDWRFCRHVLTDCKLPPGFYLSPNSPQHHHALPHVSHSHSTSYSAPHSVAHSPVSETPTSITPDRYNYSQPHVRPTFTSAGPFVIQSQIPAGPSISYPSPPCDESMSQLERQSQAEWHHSVQEQVHPMPVSGLLYDHLFSHADTLDHNAFPRPLNTTSATI